jgi:hypothetical protein
VPLPTPVGGLTHHVRFKYANDTKEIGLTISNLSAYSRQPYTPFNPATRQGEATQRDFSVANVWELVNGFHMGTGHINEQTAEFPGYSFSQGRDLTGTTDMGPCLFTAQRGRLLPAPADTFAHATSTFTKFIEFKTKLYAATSANPGHVWETDGTNWNDRLTLTGACTQLFTDGATLYACQGTSANVQSSTDGTTWGSAGYQAHVIAKRDEDNTARVLTATLTPGTDGTGPDTYRTPVIGLGGYTVNNMVWYDEALCIGKPDGLYTWQQGWIRRRIDCRTNPNTNNFKWMVEHRGLLYFNIGAKLYFINGLDGRMTEVLPDDLNGFTAIDSLWAVPFGPLLIGARMQSRSYLFYFDGSDNPGLNPLWSDEAAAKPIVGCCATDLFGSSNRIYFSQTSNGTRYLDFTTNWVPNTYHPIGSVAPYIELTEFTGGFRSVKKWWYEAVLNVRDPGSLTKAQVWYSIDDGSFTQTLDEDGNAETLDLDAYNKAAYFPLNAVGVKNKIRVMMWNTGTASASAITHITLRGATMVKPRAQISFPVVADETLTGMGDTLGDSGRRVKAAIEEMATQGYPVKFQDIDGTWRLCLFRTPYPINVVKSATETYGNQPLETQDVIQVVLTEIDELDTDGGLLAWTAG